MFLVKVVANISELETPSRGVAGSSQLIPHQVSERCVSLRWKRFFSHLLTSEESVKSTTWELGFRKHRNAEAVAAETAPRTEPRPAAPRGRCSRSVAFQLWRQTQHPAKQPSTLWAGRQGAFKSIFFSPLKWKAGLETPPACQEFHFRFAGFLQVITAGGV